MTFIDKDIAPGSSVPHLDRVIVASRGDALATGRPCYSIHQIGVAFECVESIACGGIPDFYDVIITAGGDMFAIR